MWRKGTRWVGRRGRTLVGRIVGACGASNEKSFVVGVVSSKGLWKGVQETLVLLLLLSVPCDAVDW